MVEMPSSPNMDNWLGLGHRDDIRDRRNEHHLLEECRATTTGDHRAQICDRRLHTTVAPDQLA